MGLALPPYRASSEQAAELASRPFPPGDSQRQVIERLFRRSTSHARPSVLLRSQAPPGQPLDQDLYQFGVGDRGPSTGERLRRFELHAPALAVKAASDALRSADADPSTITHVVTVSCTGMHAPGLDVALVRELGLSAGVHRLHVGFMGCFAGIVALRQAASIVRALPEARVLVVCVELCSLHLQADARIDQQIANALFADGAAAVLVDAAGPADATLLTLTDFRSRIVPGTESEMSWRIGDHGFVMSLGEQVPLRLRGVLREMVSDWISPSRTIGWAVHPGGPRVIDGVRDALELGEADVEASRAVLRAVGNVSSATVFFVLDALQNARQADATPADDVVMLAFGPGLTVEAALLTS